MKFNIILSLFILFIFSGCSKKGDVKPGGKDTVTYHHDGEVARLFYSNPKGVNIIILGDGFIKDDLKKGGSFDTQIKKVVDYLFTVAPYKQNKQYFNVYVVYAESKNRGAAKGYNPSNKATKFNAYFDKDVDRLLIDGNTDTTFKYVEKAQPLANAHLIVMVVNDSTYGGSGGSVAVVSTNELSKYIMVHEIGHTFANLGDEYVDESIAANYPVSSVPYLPNIDNTNDPDKTKWSHFLKQSAYKGIVGSYEGAYYRPNGFYRPENSSVMLDLNVLSYNAPSREAIVQRIDEIVGIPYSFSDFLKDDAGSINPIVLSTRNPELRLPKNDFINMREKIIQLQQKKKQ